MEILIIGSHGNLAEAKLKFGVIHSYAHAENYRLASALIGTGVVVFDFLTEEDGAHVGIYNGPNTPIVFLNTSTTSLKTLIAKRNIQNIVYGFCGLPTLLNRSILEVSLRTKEDFQSVEKICEELKTGFKVVMDQAGMVTPRVVCLIINEAYRTFAESIATREDIDLAMKLGTNYPYGPFDWCKRIGIKNVYNVLNSAYLESNDERYLVCPLLKEEVISH